MKKLKRLLVLVVSLAILMTLLVQPSTVGAFMSDSQVCETLKILKGEGSDVTAEFLARTSTRLQSAIISLRLAGKEATALRYTGSANFTDADQISWQGGRNILAYLKANPKLGWVGYPDGSFKPNEKTDAQAMHKVLLEALGYKQGVDFTWGEVISFAWSLGFSKAVDASPFSNTNIASALVEALKFKVNGSSFKLVQILAESGIIASVDAAAVGLIVSQAFTKYDPVIEITTVRGVIGGVKFPSGDDTENNVWTRSIEEDLGIHLKHFWSVDSSQWIQKTNLMIASGETLPDFFKATADQMVQLNNAGLIMDMTEIFNKNVSAKTLEYMGEGGNAPFNSATFNGKLMALPYTGMPKESVPMLYMRMDWLKNLGLSEPKSMSDVLKIAEAFTKSDPDKNGKNDTLGFVAQKNIYQYLTGFFNSYHAYPDMWIKDSNGKLVFGSIQPQVKVALLKLRELYADGQINKEFATNDFAVAAKSIAIGQAGIFYGPFNYAVGSLQPNHNNQPFAVWKTFPLLSIDNKPATPQASLGVYGYWVVNKKCQHPEAVVLLMNYWMQAFYTNKSFSVYTKLVNEADGNAVWQLSPIFAYRSFKNTNTGLHVNSVLDGKMLIDDLSPEERGMHANIVKYLQGDQSFYGWNQAFGKPGSTLVLAYYKDNNLYTQEQFVYTPTPTMIEKMGFLKSKQDEIYTKIIMGDPIDSFETFFVH